MNSRWATLVVIMTGSMMGTLDASIANVALPTIARSYHHSVDDGEWVLLAFMLITASTLVLFGRLGDMFGQKRMYVYGFALFGVSSLACAFSPSLGALIAARVVQALGSAMLVSSSQALIVDTFPKEMRGRAIGMNGAAVAFGLSLGPVLGGAIINVASWHWIFLINVPIALLACLAAGRVLKGSAHTGERFDLAGAALSICGLFSLSLGLSRAHVWGWTSPWTLGVIAAGVAVLAIFAFVERRIASPMLDLTLFRSRVFAMSVLAAFLYFVALSGIIFIIPLSSQIALHFDALHAGLLLMPITALNVVLAPAAGALSDRVPVRFVSTAGALIVGAGGLFLALLPPLPVTWLLVLALIVTGFGTAIFSQPNNSAIMGAAPDNRRGVAAGTLATARSSGQLLGLAAAGALYFTREAQLGPKLAATFAPASTYFAGVACMMLLVAVVSWVRE